VSSMSRKRFLVAVEKSGGILYENDYTVGIDAPAGKVWNANAGHSILCPVRGRHGWPMSEAYADIADRASMGMSDCECEDCLDALHDAREKEEPTLRCLKCGAMVDPGGCGSCDRGQK